MPTAQPSMRTVMSPTPAPAQQAPAPVAVKDPTTMPTIGPQPVPTVQTAASGTDDQPEQMSGEDWYNLLHNLGQGMLKANPDIQSLLKQNVPDIDYEAEGAKLKQQIASRPTEKPMGWGQAMMGSMTPEGAKIVQNRQERAKEQQQQKNEDLDKLQESLTMGHISDLQRKGKFQEGLATLLLQKGIGMAQAKDVQSMKGEQRAELQDRSLGAAEGRVRLQIGGREDIANKDRTVGQVMHLYESLLGMKDKDITGAETHSYSADEAMNMAMNTILPKVKPGVSTVKTGKTPGAVPSTAPTTHSGMSAADKYKANHPELFGKTGK